jgi:hypothetical protein
MKTLTMSIQSEEPPKKKKPHSVDGKICILWPTVGATRDGQVFMEVEWFWEFIKCS